MIDIGAFEFGASVIPPTSQSATADFNGDGRVDGEDLDDADEGFFVRYGEDLSGYDSLLWQRQVDAVFTSSQQLAPVTTRIADENLHPTIQLLDTA